MSLDSLLDVIRKAQKRNKAFAQRMEEAGALGRWEIAVGEVIARHSKAIRVQNSVLWVEVAHPIWRAELTYRKHQILGILNGQAPCAQKGLSAPQEILTDIFYVEPR